MGSSLHGFQQGFQSPTSENPNAITLSIQIIFFYAKSRSLGIRVQITETHCSSVIPLFSTCLEAFVHVHLIVRVKNEYAAPSNCCESMQKCLWSSKCLFHEKCCLFILEGSSSLTFTSTSWFIYNWNLWILLWKDVWENWELTSWDCKNRYWQGRKWVGITVERWDQPTAASVPWI